MSVSRDGGDIIPMSEDRGLKVRGGRDAEYTGVDIAAGPPDGSWTNYTFEADELFDFLDDFNDMVAVAVSYRIQLEHGQDAVWLATRQDKGSIDTTDPIRTNGEGQVVHNQDALLELYTSMPGNPDLATGKGGGWIWNEHIKPHEPNKYIWVFDDDDDFTVALNGDSDSSTDMNYRGTIEYFPAEPVDI